MSDILKPKKLTIRHHNNIFKLLNIALYIKSYDQQQCIGYNRLKFVKRNICVLICCLEILRTFNFKLPYVSSVKHL